MSKEFEAYPTRQLRLSDEVWKELKRQKVESGKTWNNFIKERNKNEENISLKNE